MFIWTAIRHGQMVLPPLDTLIRSRIVWQVLFLKPEQICQISFAGPSNELSLVVLSGKIKAIWKPHGYPGFHVPRAANGYNSAFFSCKREQVLCTETMKCVFYSCNKSNYYVPLK